MKTSGVSLLLTIVLAGCVRGQASDCNTPAYDASVTLPLGANAFTAVPSPDGCRIYVSASGAPDKNGITLVKRSGGKLEKAGWIGLPNNPTGTVLTHDGRLLIVAGFTDDVYFIDATKIGTNGNAVLGTVHDGLGAQHPGSVYVNVTRDDSLLFVSEENAAAITVIDLAEIRRDGVSQSAIIGRIPTGIGPIALTFSLDEKLLYTTAQRALPEWGWPAACTREGSNMPEIVAPEGAIVVVDVQKARTAPSSSVLAQVPAGCSAVRMALAPEGNRLYVSARNNDALLAFDTTKLVSDPAHARLGRVPVGTAPVPVAVLPGSRVVVGNSNRFAGPTEPSFLTVVDGARIEQGASAIIGKIQAGGFPREMRLSADGHTLFLTNFGSQSLQMIDVARLPLVN